MPATPPLDLSVLTPAECARLGAWATTHQAEVELRLHTAPERARLVWLRWLVRTGRVEP